VVVVFLGYLLCHNRRILDRCRPTFNGKSAVSSLVNGRDMRDCADFERAL
jgi:hypothetical protein